MVEKKLDGLDHNVNTSILLHQYLYKMKAGKSTNLSKISLISILVTALGSFSGIGLTAFMAEYYQLPLLLPSFGASAVLLYAACQAPMAQPRNVIGGHLVSALTGVLIYKLFGIMWWSIALGVTLAILTMVITHTLHPPGGATAFVAVYTGQNFDFILSPVLLGAVLLVIIALLTNNLLEKRKYPQFWY